MKCSKCGTPYKINDRYCGNCGTKIKKQSNLLKWFQKHMKKILTTMIGICILVAIYQIIMFFRSPEYISKKYLKALSNNDIKEITKTIDLKENDFYNEKILEEKNKKMIGATNIELIHKQIGEEKAYLSYTYKLNGNNYIASVILTKESTPFSSWKIDSGRIAKNVILKLPKEATVKIDDIDIKNYLENNSNKNYDTYIIDYMVAGEYKIEITLKDGTTITDQIEMKNNQTYSLGNIELDQTKQETLENMAKDLMNTLYHGLINNVNHPEIGYNDNIQKFYKDLNYNYKNAKYTLNSIEYTDLEIINTKYNQDSKLEVTFQTEYNYNITYTLNDTSNTYEGINRGYVTIVFDYTDNYIIEKIENLRNSFPIRK